MKKKILLMGLIPFFGIGAATSNHLVNAASENGTSYLFSDVTNRDEYFKKVLDVDARIANEGTVLLKNNGNFLPIKKGSKVSIAGLNSRQRLTNISRGSGLIQGRTTKTIDESIVDAGLNLNGTLKDFYKNNEHVGATIGNSGWKGVNEFTVGEIPVSEYPNTVLQSIDEYNDAVIFMISRQGALLGCDEKTNNCSDSEKNPNPATNRHALELSKNEEALFKELKKHTDNIIVFINSSNIYECDVFEKDPAVKSILWLGDPGDTGLGAIGRILVGEVNPSGRTVDTWARDFTKDPTFKNFGDNSQNNPYYGDQGNLLGYAAADTFLKSDGSPVEDGGVSIDTPVWEDEAHKVVKTGLSGSKPGAFVKYEEGIYVDYHYYETVYADMAKENKTKADEWYAGENGVVYPFGYGLSYTTFEQRILHCDVSGKTVSNKNSKIRFEVDVKNTGTKAGKDVVQVYFKAPYEKGKIEKPFNQLCGIGKSKMLEPGQTDRVSIEFVLQDLASYDFNDANNNGFKGYELEAGEYSVSLNKNAHEEYESFKFNIEEGFKYEKDRYSGAEIKNRFTDAGYNSILPSANDFAFTQMHRNNFEQTFPTTPSIASRTLGANSKIEEYLNHKFNMDDVEQTTSWNYIPKEAYKTKEYIETLGWTQSAQTLSNHTVNMTDMLCAKFDDSRWETILNEMTWEEMINVLDNKNNAQTGKASTLLSANGEPAASGGLDQCGACVVAATFNEELAKEQGECVAEYAHIISSYSWCWNGPNANIRRSPFGGANFNCYSSDPFLTGKIASRVVAGATSRGVVCYVSSFGLNQQRTNANSVSSFATEQALREIYLKPFQMCVQEGKTLGIMTSYSRLGVVDTSSSYPLLTEILRNEWGFNGVVTSDMCHSSGNTFDIELCENINSRLMAGCNFEYLNDGAVSRMDCAWNVRGNGGKGAPTYLSAAKNEEVESYSWWYAVRNACKQALWVASRYGEAFDNYGILDSSIKFEWQTQNCVGQNMHLNVAVNANDNIYDSKITSVSIDPTTPLPRGLSFKDGSISGTPEEAFNGFIRVIVKTEDGKVYGNALELFISPVEFETYEIPLDPPSKTGCCASIVTASALVSALAIAGAGLLVSKRKED